MISSAIIQTLKYSDHFGFPLTLSEIKTRLIKEKVQSTKQLLSSLNSLVKSGDIFESGRYYYLPGSSSLVPRRLKQELISSHQLSRAKRLASKLGSIPGVLAVYLTGSLAMSNSDEHADIDFMVITRNNRLWTTRLILTIYTELLGLRRRPNSSTNIGKVCLNLYLSPASYQLPPSKRSLYTAYELVQALPLYDPELTRIELLSSNNWLIDFLPNIKLPIQIPHHTTGKSQNNLFKIIETLLFWLQSTYMKNKITREYITKDSAYFHPNNPGSIVLKKLSI